MSNVIHIDTRRKSPAESVKDALQDKDGITRRVVTDNDCLSERFLKSKGFMEDFKDIFSPGDDAA